jgi:hypothetical protein
MSDINDEARMWLRQMAVHFAGLAVVSFKRQSFERAQRTEQGGPRLSVGEGYLVHEVHFRDDLSRVLAQVLARTRLAGGKA